MLTVKWQRDSSESATDDANNDGNHTVIIKSGYVRHETKTRNESRTKIKPN